MKTTLKLVAVLFAGALAVSVSNDALAESHATKVQTTKFIVSTWNKCKNVDVTLDGSGNLSIVQPGARLETKMSMREIDKVWVNQGYLNFSCHGTDPGCIVIDKYEHSTTFSKNCPLATKLVLAKAFTHLLTFYKKESLF